MTEEEMYEMFRLLAIAKYGDRYVIPSAHGEQAHALEELATDCPVTSYDDELMETSGPFGEGSGRGAMTPVAVENLKMLQERQTADTLVSGGRKSGRVNLLNWDGRGVPEGMFPGRSEPAGPRAEAGITQDGVTDDRALLTDGEARPDNTAGSEEGLR
jgi:nitrate reductase beta subunit